MEDESEEEGVDDEEEEDDEEGEEEDEVSASHLPSFHNEGVSDVGFGAPGPAYRA